jgi:hypothetical protein
MASASTNLSTCWGRLGEAQGDDWIKTKRLVGVLFEGVVQHPSSQSDLGGFGIKDSE